MLPDAGGGDEGVHLGSVDDAEVRPIDQVDRVVHVEAICKRVCVARRVLSDPLVPAVLFVETAAARLDASAILRTFAIVAADTSRTVKGAFLMIVTSYTKQLLNILAFRHVDLYALRYRTLLIPSAAAIAASPVLHCTMVALKATLESGSPGS
ncbi:hypothetical protein K437DRAFT_156661 [Tilletiaria anomala UBC 951]|uniref:Uncharacterized protein n=1 Tax=Tilletiaria anomala (strain ATCC 24038 / CBS 436.72 / UBC 951) TaxID=1037660 RepID=A0A066VWG8_TILAU|nr:uncharacterized protein K437DRAFT_156661 [Tilletiaria anomala UBC 951]KDN42855.1 hypothetical protein K437DRAFT_156661 [Tilletiaria anomala UBC 951]